MILMQTVARRIQAKFYTGVLLFVILGFLCIYFHVSTTLTKSSIKQHKYQTDTYLLLGNKTHGEDRYTNITRRYRLVYNHKPPATFQVQLISEPDVTDLSASTLLVFVQSHRDHFHKRHLIRTTWGESSRYQRFSYKVKVIFVCGQSEEEAKKEVHVARYNGALLELEVKHHRDMLVANFSDTYDNLSYKGLIALDWIGVHMPHLKHVLKTDDDIFLNIPAWIQVIEAMKSTGKDNYVAGLVWDTPKIRRHTQTHLTHEEYPAKNLPSFCSGSGYLMTNVSISNLLRGVGEVPFIKKDDPYFTGMVALHMGVDLFGLNRHLYRVLETPCGMARLHYTNFLVVHRFNSEYWPRLLDKILSEASETSLEIEPVLVKRHRRIKTKSN